MIYTIGYEGLSVDEFVDVLSENGVEVLVDVREMPLSRKRGFSKKSLAVHLAAGGVEYVHRREFGTPRPIRLALRSGGSLGGFADAFSKMFDALSGEFRDLGRLAAERRVCLMCFEADPSACHRSLVAARLERDGLVDGVTHLRGGARA